MTKILAPLTVRQINAAIAERKGNDRFELRDGAVPGLALRGGPMGAVWTLTTLFGPQKTRRRVSLGPYPSMGLTEARRAAQEARDGASAVSLPKLTLGALLTLYEEVRGSDLRTWRESDRCIRQVLADVIDAPLTGLTPGLIQHIIDKHAAKSSASAAVRYVRPVLRFGYKRGLCPFDGVGLEQTARPSKRRRVLDEGELRALFAVLGDTSYDAAAWVMLFTMCRLEEVCGMTPDEIDGDVWTIPASRRKPNEPLAVPLTQSVMPYIRAMPLAGRNWDRWQKRMFEKTGTSDWHRHDLRRTGATTLGRLRVAPHIVEVCLGHTYPHSALNSIYNIERYLPEHREALEMLEREYSRLM